MPKEYVPESSTPQVRRKAYISDTEGRYQIIASRFINDAVIEASPDAPNIITLPAGSKIDADLMPLEDGQEIVKLKPAHASDASQKKQSAAERFGRAPERKGP